MRFRFRSIKGISTHTQSYSRNPYIHRILRLCKEVEKAAHVPLHLHILDRRILIQRRDFPRLKLDQVGGVALPRDGRRAGLEILLGVKRRQGIFDLFRRGRFRLRRDFGMEGVRLGESLFGEVGVLCKSLSDDEGVSTVA